MDWPRSQLGKFYLSRFILLERPNEVRSIMMRCIILRAEHLLYRDEIEYIAHSTEFDSVKEGDKIPEYVWEITKAKCVAIKQG